MREHQIVISLKPEQFQEVQRQARASGARSIGLYARQKLIAFLGLEQNSGEQTPASIKANADTKKLAADLNRLRKELNDFMTESQGADEFYEPVEEWSPVKHSLSFIKDHDLPTWPAADQIQELQPENFDDSALATPEPEAIEALTKASKSIGDELEKLAERAFAISPRLAVQPASGETSSKAEQRSDAPTPERSTSTAALSESGTIDLENDPLMDLLDHSKLKKKKDQ